MNAYLQVLDQIVPEGWSTEVQRFEVRRFAFTERTKSALQRVFKRFSKVTIKVRIDQWIQCRVCISNPEEDRDHDIGTRTALAA